VQLSDQVVVDAPPESAWTRLSDVAFVAECLPGLEPSSLEEVDEGVFRARMVHAAMGVNAKWDLEARITPSPAERRLDVVLNGKEPRLNMQMSGSANVALQPNPPIGSTLDYTADIRVEGSLAAMGGPIIRSVMTDALAQFVAAVGGQEAEAPPKRGRLREALRSFWNRLFHRNARAQ
jgi:carbon monoxide dehydrogenase subunit G